MDKNTQRDHLLRRREAITAIGGLVAVGTRSRFPPRASVRPSPSDSFRYMGFLGRLRLSFWIALIGAVVLYAFFITLASVSPAEVAGLTTAIAAMALVFTARNLRVASELADPGGDPQLRRDRNKIRERRGF
jgi:hypothetical protein